jgi:hypothetical protein
LSASRRRKSKLLRRQFLEKLGIAYRYYSRFRRERCPLRVHASLSGDFRARFFSSLSVYSVVNNRQANHRIHGRRGKDPTRLNAVLFRILRLLESSFAYRSGFFTYASSNVKGRRSHRSSRRPRP